MFKRTTVATVLSLALLPMGAMAETTASSSIGFKGVADMASMRDVGMNDKFNVSLTGKDVITTLVVECKAASRSMVVFSSNETCAVEGDGYVVNPTTSQKIPRVKYSGGYEVPSDGKTKMDGTRVEYSPMGGVRASSDTFGGVLHLLPEGSVDSWISKQQKKISETVGIGDGGLIDNRLDTVRLDRFRTPSAGFPSDGGSVINGNMGYVYANDSWIIDLSVDYGGQTFKFKGNMPLTDGQKDGQLVYTLNLPLESDGTDGDDALFAEASSDLFASVDGIVGQIVLDESQMVEVDVQGEMEELASFIDMNGSLEGTNVPTDVVRSIGLTITMLARTFFGA